MDELLSDLRTIVGEGHVLAAADLRAGYETDWTGRWHGESLAVVRPADTGEVSAVLRTCTDHRVAVVAQGGNTGLVGGATPSELRPGIVLSTRRLDALGDADPALMQLPCGAGVTLTRLQQAAADAGLQAGLDLAARDSATVGGLAACNAGGLQAVRYGTARRRIAGLEVVLADGAVVSRMAGLRKDNAGYDLASLLIGSEGTLGVITQVLWSMVPRFSDRALALVAVGSLIAAHLGGSYPLPVLLLVAGAVTAVVAIIVGLPALRMPGLFLAVTTLGFAIFMQEAVLATPCWTVPGIHKMLCTGLPNPASTLIGRPNLFGINLQSQRAFSWFALAILLLSIFAVRIWRDKGIARRLVAVRDNELGAAAMGIPVLRTKLMAFGLSGFMAGYAGACLAFATERFSTTTFDPTVSFIIISMVVIGGLGSISGAVLGALYLEGLPAIFGANPTIQFLTSGLGLIAFILYLPGGLGELLHRFGDLVTMGLRSAQSQLSARRPGPPMPLGGERGGDAEPHREAEALVPGVVDS